MYAKLNMNPKGLPGIANDVLRATVEVDPCKQVSLWKNHPRESDIWEVQITKCYKLIVTLNE